jgi:hypothetical protein
VTLSQINTANSSVHLYVMGFIEGHIVPPLPPKGVSVLHHQLVGGDADVERVQLGPPGPKGLPCLRRAVVSKYLENGAPGWVWCGVEKWKG